MRAARKGVRMPCRGGKTAAVRRLLFYLSLFAVLIAASCDHFPLFNIFGERENDSKYFVIHPVVDLDRIERVGSVYGTPGGGAGGAPHNGIDIGVDPGTYFVAGCDGIIIGIARSEDEHSEVVDVALRYNEEFTISYLFEPKEKLSVAEGDLLRRGDLIGSVGRREAGYIDQCVHFWVKRDGLAVCPVPFLRPDLRKRLNDVYRTLGGRTPANLCACPEHQHYFAY